MAVSISPPPLPLPVSGAEPGVREGYVICPSCGWRESVEEASCRSCGTHLTGVPVQKTIYANTPRDASSPWSPALPVTERDRASRPLLTGRKWWMAAALLTLGVIGYLIARPVRYPAGMLVGVPPAQGAAGGLQPWALPDGTRVIPLASYEISARLLHRERYRFDAMADIAPVDFGVGWHRMSDQSVIDGFSFSNSGRYLSYTTASAEEAAMCAGSACNMHMLPANERVRDRLLDLDQGEVFFAKGYLVSVERPGMNPWTSSLTRDDTGQGACEIMWIEEIRRVEPPRAGKP